MLTNMTLTEDKITQKKGFQLNDFLSVTLSSLLSCWLILGYIVPNTIWQYISARAALAEFEYRIAGWSPNCFPIIATIFSIAIGLSYLQVAKTTQAKRFTRILVAFMALYIGRAIDSDNHLMFLPGSIMLLTFCMGLLAARISGVSSTGWTLCFCVSVQAVYTIYYAAIGQYGLLSGDLYRAGGSFHDPRLVYILFVTAIPIFVSLCLTIRSRVLQIASSVACLLPIAALGMTLYRGPLIGTLVSLVWLMLMYRKNKRITRLLVASVLGTTILTLAIRDSGHINHISSTRSTYARAIVWKRGCQIFFDHWMIGVGISNVRIVVHSIQHGRSHTDTLKQPLNSMLYWLDEMGLVGGGMCVIITICILRSIQNNASNISRGVSGSWISLFVAGISDTTIWLSDNYAGNVVLGLLIGMTIKLCKVEFNISMKSAIRKYDEVCLLGPIKKISDQ